MAGTVRNFLLCLDRQHLVYILNGFTITPNCGLIVLKVAFNC